MENAAQFKDMTATIKIGKKRTQPEMMMAAGGLPEKRQKTEGEPSPHTKSEETPGQK
jgi:hypothetical protein